MGFWVPMACGVFSDQGLNLCLLRWQAHCPPLGHQGSLTSVFKRSPDVCNLTRLKEKIRRQPVFRHRGLEAKGGQLMDLAVGVGRGCEALRCYSQP